MQTHERSASSRSSPEGVELNVVLVVLDTVRAGSVTSETMPTFFELAEEGINFEMAFSTAPWTLPSHASLFTGTYPSRHGAHGGTLHLEGSVRTITECFAANGFETIGVTNNTWITEEFGFARGFDRLHRGWQRIQSGVDIGSVVRAEHLRGKLLAARDRISEGNPLVTTANILYHGLFQPVTDDGAEASTEWIREWLAERDDGRPFFLFCNLIEPHVRYRPPRSFAEPFLPDGVDYGDATGVRQDPRAFDVGEYEISDREFTTLRALYYGELLYVDHQLSRLRNALVEAGEWERTIVIVCGDHGENIGENGFFGHQYNLSENLLHVPLAITGGSIAPGETRPDFVQLVDIPRTLLEATGIVDREFEGQQQGYSLLSEEREVRDAVFAEHIAPVPSPETLANRFGSIPEHVWNYERSLRSIRTTEHKYVRGDDGFRALYEISETGEFERSYDKNRMDRLDRRLSRFSERVDGPEGPERSGPLEIPPATKDHLSELGYL